MRTTLLSCALGLSVIGFFLASTRPVLAAAPDPKATGNQPVLIQLSVPNGAEVWFDGAVTHQTGTFRQFQSPPLAPGRDYSYSIRVRWMNGTQPLVETRRVSVRAGDTIDLAVGGPTGTSLSYASEPRSLSTRTSFYAGPVSPAPVTYYGYPYPAESGPSYGSTTGSDWGQPPRPDYEPYDPRDYALWWVMND
jgi:uncharacterized protein (TIGR03000 family)